MLKISINNEVTTTTLKLEGRLVGPWIEELSRVWGSLEPALKMRKLRLDLCGMTFADRNGTKILRKILRRADAGILADTPLTRQFAAQAATTLRSTEKENDDAQFS